MYGDCQYFDIFFNLGGAFSYCRTQMMTSSRGDRANAANVVILMTDGVSNSASYAADEVCVCLCVSLYVYA